MKYRTFIRWNRSGPNLVDVLTGEVFQDEQEMKASLGPDWEVFFVRESRYDLGFATTFYCRNERR